MATVAPLLGDHRFSNERHQHAFLASLRAYGSVPLKFAYAGSSAFVHDRFAQSSGYQTITSEVEAEASLVQDHADRMVINIADIGAGNGHHLAQLIKHLAYLGTKVPLVQLCDFSPELLQLAARRLSAACDVEIRSSTWDIERVNDPFRLGAQFAVCMFLGNTLGNVESPERVLRNIRMRVSPTTRLLVGVAAADTNMNVERVLEPYRNEAFRSAVVEPFRALGVRDEHLAFDVFYEDCTIIGEVTIAGPYLIEGHVLPSTPVVCFRSHRFQAGELENLLEESGWRVEGTKERSGEVFSVLASQIQGS